MRTASGIYRDVIRQYFPDIGLDTVYGVEGLNGMPCGSSMEDYDGLVIGGSGLRCADAVPEVTLQIEFVRQFAMLGRPILGSCWGLQIAVIAAGGSVRPSPNGREMVVARKIRLTSEGRQHVFFTGKGPVFDAPCIHYDEIASLPEGSVLLCTNAHSEVQGALIPLARSVVWGVQYHPEFDLGHLAGLLRLNGEALVRDGFFTDSRAQADHINKLETLATTPENTALAWQLGVDNDLLDDNIRAAEIVNWVRAEILVA